MTHTQTDIFYETKIEYWNILEKSVEIKESYLGKQFGKKYFKKSIETYNL